MQNQKDIEAFFLEAKARGYEADGLKMSIPDLPGSKVIRYQRGDYLYVDCWFSSGTRSFGQTVICVQGRPVWGMQYHGSWTSGDARVIPFLKRAFHATTEFVGGRGPFRFEEDSLSYRNFPVKKDFANFNGEEEIREAGKLIFSHTYSGMLL